MYNICPLCGGSVESDSIWSDATEYYVYTEECSDINCNFFIDEDDMDDIDEHIKKTGCSEAEAYLHIMKKKIEKQ